jgi:hypothetical protein
VEGYPAGKRPAMDTASIFGLVIWFCCVLYSSIRSSSITQTARQIFISIIFISVIIIFISISVILLSMYIIFISISIIFITFILRVFLTCLHAKDDNLVLAKSEKIGNFVFCRLLHFLEIEIVEIIEIIEIEIVAHFAVVKSHPIWGAAVAQW